MNTPKLTALDVLKLTDRSNCRECGAPTCMAFAAQVVSGQKKLGDCPRVDPTVAERIDGATGVDAYANMRGRRVTSTPSSRSSRTHPARITDTASSMEPSPPLRSSRG
jgi:Na+-translocating ferredoxin:NAD+ oxidoreductase RNF subunit RnfB